MSKKKKIILIIIAVIVILSIIAGLIYLIGGSKRNDNATLEGSTSKVTKLYSELTEKQNFSFTTTLDEQNAVYYAKKDNMAYIETTYQGKKSKFIIKNGNSYLLIDNQKTYYTYPNNEVNLEKITLQLEEVKDMQYVEGKEKIENKQYKYEEYETATGFLIQNNLEDTAKTRFYFNNDNKLIYIKTIAGDYEEILKVDISYDVDNSLFEIPANYQEA